MTAVKNPKSSPKVAFITGITGQDGSYLCELLLEKGYQVHGLVRPSAQRQQTLNRPVREEVTLHFGDMSDLGRLIQILRSIRDIGEIYHLAAQSHVGLSFETPLSTSDTNALGTLRLLEAMRVLGLGKTTRFYNAGTAELNGSDMPAPQTEETPFYPVSPTWYPLKPFMAAMVQLTQADGFKVAFAHLVGPDNLKLENPLDNYPYELPRMLVSNKARHVAEHFRDDGRSAVWKGFGEWSRSSDSDQKEVVIWTSNGAGNNQPERKGYYLQFARLHSTDINSTKLRRDLIQTHRLDKESLSRLSTQALVELLGQILGN